MSSLLLVPCNDALLCMINALLTLSRKQRTSRFVSGYRYAMVCRHELNCLAVRHHALRTYFTDTSATATESTTNAMPNAPTTPAITTVRTNSRLLAVQQGFHHARAQATTISRNIRQYFPGRRHTSEV
jgi:hypothetical protein